MFGDFVLWRDFGVVWTLELFAQGDNCKKEESGSPLPCFISALVAESRAAAVRNNE